MLEGIITSKTKVNLLVKLFLNPSMKAYLRELAKEFDLSTNSVRTELNILTENGILRSERDGRNVFYRANTDHPLFPELSSMVRKITGIDTLAQSVIERIGDLEAVYLMGDYAVGRDSGIIDILLIGEEIDNCQLSDVVAKSENYINRKIRTLTLTMEEFTTLNRKSSLGTLMLLYKRRAQAEDQQSQLAKQ